MKIGDTFSSWEEFEIKLVEFRNSTFQPFFTICHAKTIEKVNENTPKLPKLKTELKYFNVIIECVHYGKYGSKAQQVSSSMIDLFSN